MTLKRIALLGFVVVACVAGYLAVRNCRVTSDPASSMAGLFLFQAHCPMLAPTPPVQKDEPAANLGRLHLLQANVPF